MQGGREGSWKYARSTKTVSTLTGWLNHMTSNLKYLAPNSRPQMSFQPIQGKILQQGKRGISRVLVSAKIKRKRIVTWGIRVDKMSSSLVTFTDKDTYQNIFDPERYLHTYYNPKSGIFVVDGYLDFALKKLHEYFTTRGVKGKTLIDIGQGPTMYQNLSACEAFDEIIGADYTDRNREYYERSLRNEPGTFDWSNLIQKVCDLEGKGTSVEEKKQKLKNTVKKTLKCDVLKSNPLEPLVLPKVDCVISLGCLGYACSDLDTYRNVLKNLSSLLKIGGNIIIAEVLNCNSYLSGGKRFFSLVLTEEFMRSAITEMGFEIVDLEVSYRKYDKDQFCKYDSSLLVLARKVRDV
ncbi:nicotinamide N-methyltransferase-like [Dendropsophus ebraccatus]|uniref:nicotinamide N-methyltransferase-like n=1 Tax=Dendropsophus ebraccatus TaxID=150705 RepID=UPI0038318B63